MIARPPDPRDPARARDRRRRMGDAARILPVAGAVAFALPAALMVPGSPRLVATGLYIFVVWAILIGVAAFLARHLVRRGAEPADGD